MFQLRAKLDYKNSSVGSLGPPERQQYRREEGGGKVKRGVQRILGKGSRFIFFVINGNLELIIINVKKGKTESRFSRYIVYLSRDIVIVIVIPFIGSYHCTL